MKKSIGWASALAALALVCPAVATAATVSHFNANGEHASAYTDDGAGYSASVGVWRGGTNRAQETYLNYYWSSCSYEGTVFSCSGQTGYGLIPNAAFRVAGRSASLNVDTSGIVNVAFAFSYDWATDTYSYQELPVAGGPVALDWTRSSEFSYRSSGTSESSYLNYKFISNGTSQASSARATGSLLGTVFAGQGGIGRSRNVSISIEK